MSCCMASHSLVYDHHILDPVDYLKKKKKKDMTLGGVKVGLEGQICES